MKSTDDYVENMGSAYVLYEPPKPTHQWCIHGDWHSMTVNVFSQPHWLGRILQKYLLDIHWRKIDEN